MNPKISADHLKRRAIVYIRQSSPGQVIHNQESQRRQYGLADHARQLGFQQVEIIDEDLGRSGSGQVPTSAHHLCEVVLEKSIVPVGVPMSLTEAEVKLDGEKWTVHKYDADPFPSNPHAHCYAQ